MAIASGSRVILATIPEVTLGVTPAGTLKPLRHTKGMLTLKKEGYKSEEIVSNRQTKDFRLGFREVEASIETELLVQAHDEYYESALAGAFSAPAPVSIATAVVSGNKLTRATGSFITDGYRVGDIVTLSAFAASSGANNGTVRLATVSALEVSLVSTAGAPFAKTLIADTTGTMTYAGKRLDCGTTMKPVSIEQGFTDIAQYRIFSGMAVNDLDLKIQPKGMVKATFGLIGKDVTPFTATPKTHSAAGTTTPLDAFSGAMWEAGVPMALITGIDLKLANGRTTQAVVGSKVTPDIFEGNVDITGTATVLFQDATMFSKFDNETESSLDVLCMNAGGTEFLRFVLPRIKFSTGGIEPPAEGPVPITMEFTALIDSVTGTSFYMQRSNAA